MADLEGLLNKANAEAAACRERIREFEENVYGRLTKQPLPKLSRLCKYT